MLYGPRCPLGWKNISKRRKATCISQTLSNSKGEAPHTRPLGTKGASEARAGGPLPQLGTGQTSQAPKAISLIRNWQQLKQEPRHDSKDKEAQMMRW